MNRKDIIDLVNSSEKELINEFKKQDKICEFNTFKVETDRADKSFPVNSMDFSRQIGGLILKNIPNKKKRIKNELVS